MGQQRAGLSQALEGVVIKCLAKRPADRLQTADELMAVLEPLATPSGGMTPTHTMPIGAVAAPRSTPRWVRGLIAGVAVIVVVAAALVLLNRPLATAALVQPLQLTRSAGVQDGQWLAFDSDRLGTQQVFRRRLAGGEVQQITHGTSPAFFPALSPDGGGRLSRDRQRAQAGLRGLERRRGPAGPDVTRHGPL